MANFDVVRDGVLHRCDCCYRNASMLVRYADDEYLNQICRACVLEWAEAVKDDPNACDGCGESVFKKGSCPCISL